MGIRDSYSYKYDSNTTHEPNIHMTINTCISSKYFKPEPGI